MTESKTDRGQVGIGTLIVFIAMVLVAAIAAGVLINTAGLLQSRSEQTGEESSRQVSDRIQEVVVVGQNIDGAAGTLKHVNVTISQAPGAGSIDLQNATVQWIGPTGTYTLTYGDVGGVDGKFEVFTVKDADGSSPVLNDPDDRLEMGFNVSRFASSDLGEGEEVTIRINTMSGASTSIRFTVPESLDGETAVEL